MHNKNLIEEALEVALDLHDNFDDNKSKVIQLLQQALAPAPKFYVGQPVLVSDNGKDWHKTILENIREEQFICEYEDGEIYEYCKPDPTAPSRPNWIEHDGRGTPMFSMGDIIAVQYRNGESDCTNDDHREFSWKHDGDSGDIIRYCVIIAPEFLKS